MAIIVPNEAEVELCNFIADGMGGGCTIRLYKNDLTPVAGTVLADFEQCDFESYLNKTFTGWTEAVTNGDGDAEMVALLIYQWIRGAGAASNTAYGWYIVNAAGDKVLMARRFTAPVDFSAPGDHVEVQPVFTLRQRP